MGCGCRRLVRLTCATSRAERRSDDWGVLSDRPQFGLLVHALPAVASDYRSGGGCRQPENRAALELGETSQWSRLGQSNPGTAYYQRWRTAPACGWGLERGDKVGHHSSTRTGSRVICRRCGPAADSIRGLWRRECSPCRSVCIATRSRREFRSFANMWLGCRRNSSKLDVAHYERQHPARFMFLQAGQSRGLTPR